MRGGGGLKALLTRQRRGEKAISCRTELALERRNTTENSLCNNKRIVLFFFFFLATAMFTKAKQKQFRLMEEKQEGPRGRPQPGVRRLLRRISVVSLDASFFVFALLPPEHLSCFLAPISQYVRSKPRGRLRLLEPNSERFLFATCYCHWLAALSNNMFSITIGRRLLFGTALACELVLNTGYYLLFIA